MSPSARTSKRCSGARAQAEGCKSEAHGGSTPTREGTVVICDCCTASGNSLKYCAHAKRHAKREAARARVRSCRFGAFRSLGVRGRKTNLVLEGVECAGASGRVEREQSAQ